MALVKLKQSIEFTENVMPACLPFDEGNSYFDCYVTGWGYTGILFQLCFYKDILNPFFILLTVSSSFQFVFLMEKLLFFNFFLDLT